MSVQGGGGGGGGGGTACGSFPLYDAVAARKPVIPEKKMKTTTKSNNFCDEGVKQSISG